MLTAARLVLLLSLAGSLVSCDQAEPGAADSRQPNILLIIADDVGMAELGAFGGEIPTPHLDALANRGVKLVAFHTSPVCSPSRAMLFTGVDNHLAGLGNMHEEMAPNQQGQPGYEGHLNRRVVTVASLLRDAGYRTYYSGKWHLGASAQTAPGARGFDRAFSLLSGGAHHYSDMKPAYAPTPGTKAPFMEDGRMLDELPESYEYSSQFLVDRLIEYLDDGAASGERSQRPFFAVLSFMATHWPLQAPDQAVRKYRGQYDRGYEAVARQRLARQVALGIVPEHAALPSPPPRPWDQLSRAQQRIEARAMEIYAAMVDLMDQNVGRLIAHLRREKSLENTLIIFISDNGAEGHDIDETWPADLFPAIRATIDQAHDFSYENMGRPNSYTFYGPNWAWAGAPFLRGHKGSVNEGGIRTPVFVHYPARFASGAVHSGQFHITDIVPTLLDVAGIAHPGRRYADRDIAPVTGISMAPYLRAGQVRKSPERRVEIGEVLGKRYVMKRPWKLVHQPVPLGSGQWQLFNLDTDLAESTDLAAEHPALVAELRALWGEYAREKGVILPNWVSGY